MRDYLTLGNVYMKKVCLTLDSCSWKVQAAHHCVMVKIHRKRQSVAEKQIGESQARNMAVLCSLFTWKLIPVCRAHTSVVNP